MTILRTQKNITKYIRDLKKYDENVIEKFVLDNSHNRIIKMSFINCINEYVKQIEHLFWLEYEGELKLEAELESMTYEPKIILEYILKAKYNDKYKSEFILTFTEIEKKSYKVDVVIK